MGVALLCALSVTAQQTAGGGHNESKTDAFSRFVRKFGAPAYGLESQDSPAACNSKGSLAFGSPVTSVLGNSSSCYDSASGIWIDFWTFSGQAGQRVRVSFSSTPAVLATIQDYSTGDILADSSGCGVATSCSFEYTLLSTTQYIVGLGSYSTGSYTLTLTSVSTTPGGAPNLTPYRVLAGGTCTPADLCSTDWSDRIVVSNVTGTHSDSASLSSTNNLYVDWAVNNSGNASTQARVWTDLYVDGGLRNSWYVDPPLAPNFYTAVQDYSIGSLPPGNHTIRIKTDATSAVAESNENDNEYTKSFTVGGGGSCAVGPTTLCLLGGRFRVEVSWRVASQGQNGVGHAVPMTSDTGHFWFFSSSNVELVIKVLDGRSFNNKYWVFFGALSDVEYTITVTDTATGAVRTYSNPQGRLASVADTSAF